MSMQGFGPDSGFVDHTDMRWLNDNAQPGSARVISGFWRRLGALFIDSLLLAAFGFLVGNLFFDFWASLGIRARLFGFAVCMAYFGFFNSSIGGGQTPGKHAFNIIVVDKYGNCISLGRSFLRTAILCANMALTALVIDWGALPSLLVATEKLIISIITTGISIGLVYFYIFNVKTRQSLHDLICGTYVLTADSPRPFSAETMNKVHYYIYGVILSLITVGLIIILLLRPGSQYENVAKSFPTDSLQEKYGIVSYTVKEISFLDQEANQKQLSVDIRVNRTPTFYQAMKDEAALIVMQPDIENRYGTIVISVTYGYDIGIARYGYARTESKTPAEWKRYIQPQDDGKAENSRTDTR